MSTSGIVGRGLQTSKRTWTEPALICHPPPPFRRRRPRLPPEEAAEVPGVRKAQAQGNLFDAQRGVDQFALRFQHQPRVQYVERGVAQDLVADAVELRRRDAQRAREFGQAGLLTKARFHLGAEALYVGFRAQWRDSAGGRMRGHRG